MSQIDSSHPSDHWDPDGDGAGGLEAFVAEAPRALHVFNSGHRPEPREAEDLWKFFEVFSMARLGDGDDRNVFMYG